MIKFDPSKITLEYVYVRKIFKNFVEVICDNDKKTYDSTEVKFKRLKDGSVQIPIHYKVYSLYTKKNSLLHFDAEIGKKTCILFYDGKVLSIDVYRQSYFTKNEPESTWTSANEGVISHLIEMLKINDNVYIDGESIFFMDKMIPITKFKTNELFWIQPVRYIELSKMGIKKYRSELLSKDECPKSNKSDNDALIILKNGFVLGFNPNILNPEEEQINVYSPVFSGDYSKSKKENKQPSAFGKESSIGVLSATLFGIENKENPRILNLDFVLKAAKVIGEHYSFEETDFLDIPKIILETNILNLKTDITRQSRSKFPVSIEPFEGLAYVMRYCHMEKDLDVYRDLVSLFTFTIKYGFVSKKLTGDIFMDGKDISDITRLNYKEILKNQKIVNA
jgi:hypothetical protein